MKRQPKTASTSTIVFVAASASLFALACGGAASSPPKSAAAEAAPAGGAQAGFATAAPAAPPPAPPAAQSTPNADSKSEAAPGTAPTRSGPSGGARDPSLHRAVEAAQRELDMAGSDCAAACRALGSMERATARLCTLEEASCEDVRVRLLRSRERVRTTCGGCPGGPSVNPDAPIPSR